MSDQRDNSGIISRNDRKTKENHPDHKGHCTVAGVEYWISGWVKEARDTGRKFLSIAFQPKEKPVDQNPAPQEPKSDDTIEF